MHQFRIVRVLVALILAMSVSASAQSNAPRCDDDVAGVTWKRWESGQSTLEPWCASVGPPHFKGLPVERAEITRLLIVTWNVHVGGGQLEDFVTRYWTDRSHTGLVLLLEETYRGGPRVPVSYPQELRVPSAIRPNPRTPDITELAKRLRMSAAYVPSMRNGSTTEDGAEDRGNAILSTESLSDVTAIELPFGKQRRVAVAATVTPRGSTIAPLRVIATHFDLNQDRVAQAEALVGQIGMLTGLPIVVGGDFNSRHGLRDESVKTMGRALKMQDCGLGRTNKLPLRLDLLGVVGRLDHFFSDLGSAGLAQECLTIKDWFGSDHRPVILKVHR